MKKYEYFKVNNEISIDYILPTSTNDVYFLYDEIYEKLSKQKGNRFDIIIDLIIRNGFTFNRFIILEFNENKVTSRILNPREVSEEIKKNTKKYLQKNELLLLDSALPKSTIDFMLFS